MKVDRKHIDIRDDCFRASDHGVRVRIAAHRHEVHVDIEIDGATYTRELSLRELAELLKQPTTDQ